MPPGPHRTVPTAAPAAAAVPAPTVRDRLLDAAIATAADHGLSRLSVADVARRADLSRQTLYKHFSSRDDLVAAAVLREAGILVEQVVAAADEHVDARDSLEAAFVTTLRLTRAHPLLDRLVRTEPEALLPLLMAEGGAVNVSVRAIVEQIMARRVPELGADDRRRAADLLSRVLISYAVNAPDEPPEVVASFIATLVLDGVTALTGVPVGSSPPDAPAGVETGA